MRKEKERLCLKVEEGKRKVTLTGWERDRKGSHLQGKKEERIGLHLQGETGTKMDEKGKGIVCEQSMRKGNDKFGTSRLKKREKLGFNLTIILLKKYAREREKSKRFSPKKDGKRVRRLRTGRRGDFLR